MSKIKAIIKRPDEEYGHMTNISCTLENLQKTVGGHIETLHLGMDTVLIVNEEGRLLGLEPNFRAGYFRKGYGIFITNIVGTIIVVGQKGDDFCDCPIDFKTWKLLLKEWGN